MSEELVRMKTRVQIIEWKVAPLMNGAIVYQIQYGANILKKKTNDLRKALVDIDSIFPPDVIPES